MELSDFKIIKKISEEKDKYRHLKQVYLCLCSSCNKEFKIIIFDNNLSTRKSNKCKSCTSTKHNKSKTSDLYKIWASIRYRIKGKNRKDKIVYKDKNIKLFKQWNDFLVFENWALSNGYKKGLTIDRIDNDGNYEPSNCRWVNQIIQNRNNRKLRSTNKSGLRGVSFRKDTKKWVAEIIVNYKKISLGCYTCRLKAGYARENYIINNNLEHTLNFN